MWYGEGGGWLEEEGGVLDEVEEDEGDDEGVGHDGNRSGELVAHLNPVVVDPSSVNLSTVEGCVDVEVSV